MFFGSCGEILSLSLSQSVDMAVKEHLAIVGTWNVVSEYLTS